MPDLLQQYLAQPQGGQYMSPQVLAMQQLLGGTQPPTMPGPSGRGPDAYIQLLAQQAQQQARQGAGTVGGAAGAMQSQPEIEAASQFLQNAPPEVYNQMIQLMEGQQGGKDSMGAK